MSHTTTISTKLKDEKAIADACKEMGLPIPVRGSAALFEGSEKHEGLLVKLPGWTYPVIINTKTGEAKFDNYEGKWGEQKHLDKFKQLYAVHAATAACRRMGKTVSRTSSNGKIYLTMNV